MVSLELMGFFEVGTGDRRVGPRRRWFSSTICGNPLTSRAERPIAAPISLGLMRCLHWLGRSPETDTSALETNVSQLARGLALGGHEVDLRSGLRGLSELVGDVRADAGRRYDLVHLHDEDSPELQHAMRLLRPSAIPWCVTLRDPERVADPAPAPPIDWESLSHARLIHVPDRAALVRLTHSSFALPPIELIPDGLPPLAATEATLEGRSPRMRELASRRPLVVVSATMKHHTRTPAWAEVLDTTPRGTNSYGARHAIRWISARSDPAAELSNTHVVDDTELGGVLGLADLCLELGDGRGAFAAWQRGTPALVVGTSPAAAWCARIDPELVCAASDMHAALSTFLATDPGHRQRTGLRARDLIQSELSWNAVAERMARAYTRMLEPKRAAGTLRAA